MWATLCLAKKSNVISQLADSFQIMMSLIFCLLHVGLVYFEV
jgi:hypothetical protein